MERCEVCEKLDGWLLVMPLVEQITEAGELYLELAESSCSPGTLGCNLTFRSGLWLTWRDVGVLHREGAFCRGESSLMEQLVK